jgi:hypothetical protein
MLYARVTLRIKREETESDSKVVLYRGDYNIDIEFTLESTVYILSESAYAQLIITRPYADSIFSQLYKIKNDTTTIRITRDMIDELNELEIYSIQIRLFDENRIARVTIPPCYGVIHVKNPIASEPISDDVAKVNLANVNYNTVSKDYEYIVEEIFTDGIYNKTTWLDGDLISDTRLNKIEHALHTISQYDGGMTDEEKEQMNKNTNDISTILGIVDTPPTYTNPSLSIKFNTNTLEHNKSTSVVITPTFSQNDAGGVTKYILYRDGNEIFSNTTASTHTDNVTISHGSSSSYSATIIYGDGPIKNTLLGIPYPNTSIKAGSVSASGIVRGYALSYYGVIDTSTITENDISSLSSRLGTNKSFTHTTDLSEQRVIYVYPQSFGVLTSIKDANNFDYINSYTRTSLTHNSVDYYVYILTDPVTITGFKQIFN